MKNQFLLLTCFIFLIFSCKKSTPTITPWVPYDESAELIQNANHPKKRMQYKLIQSKVLDKNDIWKTIAPQIVDFSEEDYQRLKPLILEQDILTLQSNIDASKLTYEQLTQWYLYRIVQFENDKEKTLHSIIAINPKAVEEARQRDKNKTETDHPLFGMPILLKDNINTAGMNTTAGAHALLNNQTDDAFIVKRIKAKGGIILGKANLSEWAYYFCQGCPVGYSAVGGQTLNPYGRKQFETGGSSSGSGTTMAANYAVVAVGTETSGSILSPSSQNSIVGLKPTIGLLSRSGIVPISSTLDTPGPMTRSVMDNAIFLSAMIGKDATDKATDASPAPIEYWKGLAGSSLQGVRLGVNQNFLEDSIYNATVEKIKTMGATIIIFTPGKMNREGFTTVLNGDMQKDLPKYLEGHGGKEVMVKNVKDVLAYNLKDTSLYAPYGQGHFENIANENISDSDLAELIQRFEKDARHFFDEHFQAHQLDAILSINNWNAGNAAMAKYPCLTVPMGYKASGEPINLTFIAPSFQEEKLLKLGYAFEQATKMRRVPKGYE